MKIKALLIACAAIVGACTSNEMSTTDDAKILCTTPNGEAINCTCDTIVYNVVVKGEDENLEGFDADGLIDKIFQSVYTCGAQVVDYQTEEPLSIDDVKDREVSDPRYSRSLISLLQFTEIWHYDAENVAMYKEVKSIHVAYDAFDENGEFIGYRAGFILLLNQ